MQEGKELKVLICQLNPSLEKKRQNLQKTKKMLSAYDASANLDVIVFPEMAFTGYNFKDRSHASTVAVKCGEGPQFQFARALALRCKSYVLFGYVESREEGGNVEQLRKETRVIGQIKLYNSAAVMNRDGDLVLNYAKTHLFLSDELWAEEGNGFAVFELITTKGVKIRCGLGICMDINPKHFIGNQCQLAEFLLQKECEVLLFPTNWLTQGEEIIKIYNYWMNRLKPILRANKQLIVIVANRIGREYSYIEKSESVFSGGSCVLATKPPNILLRLSTDNEGCVFTPIQL